MITRRHFLALASSSVSILAFNNSAAFADQAADMRAAIDAAVKPLLTQYGIPGLAVGVTLGGARHFAEYGHASPTAKTSVARETLFELGSISKTFAVTLAALAAVRGKLALDDTVGQHVPELQGSPIADVRLHDLATHTAGGFPLQIPDAVKTDAELMTWYRAWKPKYAAGAMRTYANPSIALLGIAAAQAMNQPFDTLMEQVLFPGLGLKRTYVTVPPAEKAAYAWGTNKAGKPVHANPSPIAAEAYGVKSNTTDMLRFLEVQMGLVPVADEIARAVAMTHEGRARSGPFIQDLVWEQYPLPASLAEMQQGNSNEMSLKANPAQSIEPPMPPRADVILNKTGSTGGFGAYVFAVPQKKLGIVLLANKFYPNEARTEAAWKVMEKVAG